MSLRRVIKPVARLMIIIMMMDVFSPLATWALTGGPSQPEFSGFEPVGTASMVNEFNGNFTYNLPILNIPGPNGSGYPLSLSYHSGNSSEDDASWVGFGWTLNPGSIVRNTRGLPDDYSGEEIKYWNRMETNWTVTVGTRGGIEIFSYPTEEKEKKKDSSVAGKNLTVSGDVVVRYNNFKGFGTSIGLSAGAKGVGDLGFSMSDGEGSFRYSVSPALLLSAFESDDASTAGTNATSLEDLMNNGAFLKRVMNRYAGQAAGKAIAGVQGFVNNTFGEVAMPTKVLPYTGYSINFSVGVQGDPTPSQAGFNGGLNGSYSEQQNVESVVRKAYGYMYSDSARDEDVMDYYTEKDSPYNKRDENLALPFSNADSYTVMGEGLSGGFRLFNRRVGHYHLPKTESSLNIYQMSADAHIGSNVGLGGNIGVGNHTLRVGTWGEEFQDDYRFSNSTRDNDNVFFRFNNDLGGNVIFEDHDDPTKAYIKLSGNPVYPDKDPGLDASDVMPSMNQGNRSGRSVYIGYSTYGEIDSITTAGCDGFQKGKVNYNSYTKDETTRSLNGLNPSKHQIGEFGITKADGSRYVYGLPVLARSEKNLQHGLKDLPSSNIKHNYLAYKHVSLESSDDEQALIGQEMNAPYVTTYLLTEITTPDYIDRTNDGPTPDDLGGYTKFNYERTTSDSWYRWRTPYNGLLYNRNSMSDATDDMGSMSSGEKEIFYLKSIETRTHIAYFITEGGRLDAFEASHDEASAAGDSVKPTGTNPLLRSLRRIELWSKDEDGNAEKLLSTVHFRYNYSLCKNLPNSARIGVTSETYGKLTLERVWFEYEGAANVRVSPYVFGYEYRKTADYATVINGVTVATDPRLSGIVGYGDHLADAYDRIENPDYSPFAVDRWGSYRNDGPARFSRFNTWVNQVEEENFDPAAWQLKWIKLPSGGEIHVQYEQNEYKFVQSDPVMVMANLKTNDSDPNDSIHNDDIPFKYILDLEACGIPEDSVESLVTLMRKRFVDGGEKIYYKFLHTLADRTPTLGDCTSEFLSGYVPVRSVTTDMADNIVVELGTSTAEAVPRLVAKDFLEKVRNGNLDYIGICGGFRPGMSNSEDDVKGMIRKLHQRSNDDFSVLDENCSKINVRHSYLRIPFLAPANGGKKGGGVRVKRLLMYDSGIETGDAALFGTEYSYVLEDGSCSGVATNEPAMGREENPLVGYIGKRREQNLYQQIVAGEDKEQFEGPLGESLLPAPSVGYSRVVISNIHQGHTTPGYSVKEFYTAREYPFDLSKSERCSTKGFKRTGMDQEDDYAFLPGPGIAYTMSALYRTQGYRFILNNMHGQVKRVASYAGSYSSANDDIVESQEYEYFDPGETIPLMSGPDKDSNIVYGYPGKEMEVVFETRLVEDLTRDINMAIDGTLGLSALPIPLVGWFPSADFGESTLGTHVTTKVVRYPAIVKRVVAFKDGATHTTENVGFDPETGNPVLTRTWDGYHELTLQQSPGGHSGWYYHYTQPASSVYSSMSQKAAGERALFRSGADMIVEKRYLEGRHYLNFRILSRVLSKDVLQSFSEGDLVEVREGETVNGQERPDTRCLGLFRVGAVGGNRIELLPPYDDCSYVSSDPLNSKVSVRIVRSGRTNQLGVPIGTISTYGRPPIAKEHPLN